MMTQFEWIQSGTAIATLCILLYNVYMTNIVHKLTNSMKDQLVHTVATAEHAKGVIVGREEVAHEEGAIALAEKNLAATVMKVPVNIVPVTPVVEPPKE